MLHLSVTALSWPLAQTSARPIRGGGYASMTGTSMAAPVVSAALALLRQNWPHLDGNQLASILLETADKSIPGYQEHIHGQGLLDMDRATQPVGETGIPLGASVTGSRVPAAGGGTMAGISTTAVAALSGVMLLDGYERDFYVDLAGGLVPVDTRRGSLAAAGGLTDGYAGYFDPESHLAVRVPVNSSLSLIGGAGAEQGGFLGNRLSGALGNVAASWTGYALANLHHPAGSGGTEIFGQLGAGVTRLEIDNRPSLMQGAGTVLSSTASIGVSSLMAGGRFGLALTRPVQLDRAEMRYRLPVSRGADGDVSYESREVDFSPARREMDVGLFFRRGWFGGVLSSESFVEWRRDAPHGSTEVLVEAGVRLRMAL